MARIMMDVRQLAKARDQIGSVPAVSGESVHSACYPVTSLASNLARKLLPRGQTYLPSGPNRAE